jgi:cyclophilin family peptidyl-prolyl cis-trans isomerase
MPRRAGILCLAAVTIVLAGCGGGGSDDESTDTAASATCEAVEAPKPHADGGATKPTEPLDPGVIYTLTFATNCGSFTVTLDQQTAPQTAASLVSLARAGFYDETVFHRIVPGFVIQGGDPTASGSGGPGYETVDPPPADAAYTKGVVAMAKAADEAPGTAGSQFFVVTGEDIGLPAEYAVVGEVTAGQDVVDMIGQLGDPVTEKPTEPVVISTVTVRET